MDRGGYVFSKFMQLFGFVITIAPILAFLVNTVSIEGLYGYVKKAMVTTDDNGVSFILKHDFWGEEI